MISKIYEEEFPQKVLNSDRPAVVDFYADWCGPCKMLSPVMEELANENSDFDFFKVNVDDNPQLAAALEINAIPAVLIFKNGELAQSAVGFNSKEAMQNLIDSVR